ncbi:SMI1/KNR4 family protein [Nonomuraea sp. NPDC048916]|uniref:SMI1/KNR4 family protein n=1 Tax=Nonomuraea sp. NPDC048916 TaxID=3154232 RepID=UPI0033FC68F5
MVKLVRLALTAAVLTAIAVRLRRRARMPEARPERPGPVPGRPTRADLARHPVRRTRRAWPALLGVGAMAAAVLVFATQVATPVGEEPEWWTTFRSTVRAEPDVREPDVREPDVREPGVGEQGGQEPGVRELVVHESEARESGARESGARESEAPELGARESGARESGAPESGAPEPVAATPPSTVPDPACRPERRPVAVRPIDPKVRRAVDRQWRRIEGWLKARAPRTYVTLGHPGRARTIAIAEAQTGLDFPDDLRASLLRHNGTGGFGLGPTAPSSGIREIRDLWRDLCRLDPADVGHEPREEWWNGRMIPFAYRADMGYGLIDSQVGDVGWDDLVAGRTFPAMPSYYALLRATADALEQDGQVGGWVPRVTRGTLRWTPQS